MKLLFPFALLCLSAVLRPAASEPPVRDSTDLVLVTLNRLELAAQPQPAAGLLPEKSKQLPLSVQPYLKPSGQLDALSGPVQKAAAQVRRALAPGAGQKDRLRDAGLLAQGVRDWLAAHLTLDPASGTARQPALDQRQAWPKASAILKAGSADSDGQALAAVALLRALKVPARVAWARGHWTPQYWCALPPSKAAPAKRGKGSKGAKLKAAKAPLGYWCLLDTELRDWDVDAYSLDAGVLARLRWAPAEELSAWSVAWERCAFAQSDSVAARAAWQASVQLGSLTVAASAVSPAAAGMALPLGVAAAGALQGLTQGSAVLWVLTAQRWRVQTDGALGGLEPVEIGTPYRPQLASWGRELPGAVLRMEMEAQGVWSDRPGRLRLHSAALADEWSSPPPALGVLHAFRLGLKRHASVLQAVCQDHQIQGVLLRSDNLSPRSAWTVDVKSKDATQVIATVPVSAQGSFVWTLSPTNLAEDWVTLESSGGDQEDSQRIELKTLSK